MSGVTVGTRLERLRALLAHVKAEIEHEERALAGGYLTDVIPPLGTPGRPEADDGSTWSRAECLAVLTRFDVTTAELRTWAFERGLMKSRRGTLASGVFRAYEIAHERRGA